MIVCNATPLISLAAIDSLELLNMLIPEWCVPEAVYKEATISDKPFAENLAIFLEGKVKKVKNKAAVNDLRLFLDAGESVNRV